MKKFIYLLFISNLLLACSGNTESTEDSNDQVVDDSLTPERAAKAQLVFHTVPSPLETASIFQNAGSVYNPEITNPVENVNKYATNTQKAINLGVYGADLSYANIFDQTQESMFYMNCSKKMSDGLGVTSAFDEATMERMEENMNNRDSLMIIINDAFWLADAYLKENGQDNLSALIITGGWVEGLFLGTKALKKDNPDKELMKKIAEQKYSLTNLMELLATYNNEDVKKLGQTLTPLKTAFDKVKIEESEATVSNQTGVPTIDGGSTLTYETSTILEIAVVIEKIRNEIIK
ncbi:MAG: hypothetical protein COX70_08035 [Flavobacteriales bacterium CG_4_10_14_0_2_um_filter_32_8]|nr:MAG: hypothetical protein COX70_08035 [Flavobacteriales bacterium CG_4_10_14_0_2_um_filter_32_8]